MFVKIQSCKTAQSLKELGFNYTTEIVNGITWYCFEQSNEFAKAIMTKFADEPLILDGHLHF